jgi:hypothetical protein
MLWMKSDTSALAIELKQPGESLHAMVDRALRTLAQAERGGHAGEVGSYPERKARIVARLREMKAGKDSNQAIADQLNADGVPTLSGRGRWHKGTIADLLAEAKAAD